MDMMYKRIVTLGMISVTSLLGWIYCVLNFKDQPVYIVIVSLIFVISVYVLLNALRRLKLEKEIELKETIQNTANEIIEKSMEAAYSEESERLAKATYVQLRRISTTLNGMNERAREEHEERVNSDRIHQDDANYVLTSTINKAAKVLVKYNTENNDKLLASLSELCEKLEAIKIPEVPVVQETKKTADVIPFPNAAEKTDNSPTEEPVASEETIASDESADEPAEDSNRQLTADEIAALFAAADTPAEEPATSEKPVAAEEPAEDPNRQLTADEIAALFAAADTPAEEPTTIEEPVAAEEPAENPNRQLTAAEIEALFAAAESKKMEEEPKEEPTVTEEPAEDPNRQLTAAEIEALFAAAESKQIEEEIKEEPPVAEEPPADSNRPLTPDEIAALFASMGS